MLASDSLAWATASAERYEVHEATEIAWIIVGLSQLGKTGGIVRRDTPYFGAIERWFAAVRDHPVVAALGPSANLPRFVGNAADYRFDTRGGLVRRAGAVALWDDPAGDLFTRHLSQIENFARLADARRFLKDQSATLAASHRALLAVVDMADIATWLATQFPARPAPVRIFVSPLTGGWNWTNLGGDEPRIWVPEPPTNALENPVRRFRSIASVVTEVDHIYVNPVTERHAAAVAATITKSGGWATDAAWADYPTPELVFNEYMTYAVFLEYARARLSSADHSAVMLDTVTFMQTKRGFPRFGSFVATTRRLKDLGTGTLSELFPAILSHYAKS